LNALSSIVLGALGVLFGAEPPPGHPPMGHGAAMPTSIAPTSITISVVALSPSGRLVSGAGAEVRLELTRMGEMGGELERAWITTADAEGRATFADVPPLAPGRQLGAIARWHGVEWRGDVRAGAPTTIVAYSLTADRASLRASLSYTLIPSEEELIIDQLMRVTTGDDPRAVDLERGEGLRVPLLVHAVFGAPAPGGWMPPRPSPDTTRFSLQPPSDQLGRLVVERGELVYRGIVPPSGVTILAQYPVSYADDTRHLLAMSSPVALELLQLTLPARAGLAPEVALRTPFQTIVRPTGDGVQRLLVPLTLPAPGEPLLVDVHDTPSRLAFVRPMVVGLTLGVVVVLWLAFLRTRRGARGAAVRGDVP